jgi:hypothetical protein
MDRSDDHLRLQATSADQASTRNEGNTMTVATDTKSHENILATIYRLIGKEDRTKEVTIMQGILTNLPKERVRTAKRELSEAVARSAAGGSEDLNAFARAVVNAQQEDLALTLLQRELADALMNRRDQSIAPSITTAVEAQALEYLNMELARVIEVVRECDAALGSVANADHAIRAGQSNRWAVLNAAVADYDAIRAGQNEVYLKTGGGTDSNIPQFVRTSGLLADAIDKDGYWTARRRNSSQQSPRTFANEKAWDEWLRAIPMTNAWPAVQEGHWPTSDKHAYLRWIATNATPWVPSLAVLKATHISATTATASTQGNGVTAWMEAARAEYFELTRVQSTD